MHNIGLQKKFQEFVTFPKETLTAKRPVLCAAIGAFGMTVTLGSVFLSNTEVTALGQEHSFANGEITAIENDVTYTAANPANEPIMTIGDTLTIAGVDYTIVEESGGESIIEYDAGSGVQTITGNVSQFELDDGAGGTLFASVLGGEPGIPLGIPAGSEILGYTASPTWEGTADPGWEFDISWFSVGVGSSSTYQYGTDDYTAPTAPCFTPGTMIETPEGLRDVDDLAVGDLVMTKDRGPQPLRWVFKRTLAKSWFKHNPSLTPMVIAKGALGPNTPSCDTKVSPGHMFLIEAVSGEGEAAEVLVPTQQFIESGAARQLPAEQTTYIHLMFDQHEIVRADGAWSESFRPGPASLHFMGSSARRELLTIFPELSTKDGLDAYTPVRTPLYRKAARRAISSALAR